MFAMMIKCHLFCLHLNKKWIPDLLSQWEQEFILSLITNIQWEKQSWAGENKVKELY